MRRLFVGTLFVIAVVMTLSYLGSSATMTAASTLSRKAKAEETKRYQANYTDPEAATGDPVKDAQTLATLEVSPAPQGGTTMMAASTMAMATPSPDSPTVLQHLAASKGGRWQRLADLPQARAYHLITGPQGQILLIAGSGNDATTFAAGTFKAYLWNIVRGVWKTIFVPTDMFCSGHLLLSNGKGLAVGGTAGYSPWKGAKTMYTFDFVTHQFIRQSDMVHGRWYPTVVREPGMTSLIYGGFDENGMNSGSTEVYDEHMGMTHLVSDQMASPFPLYPHLFMLNAAKMFYSGVAWSTAAVNGVVHAPGFWNPNTGSFKPVPGITVASRRGSGASCFLGDVRQGKLMIMGGGWPATRSTNVINLFAAHPAYHAGPPLRSAKSYVSCVMLPNGQVLEANGGNANHIANASHEVSVLRSPSATRWTPMNPLPAGTRNHRLYHSMLFMLDDGSVISMGSNPAGQARSYTVWRFLPDYFFKGTRPQIVSAPRVLHYGKTYQLKFRGSVSRVALLTRSSPTHSMDVNARGVSLRVINNRITLRFSANKIPTGYVTLWAINKNQVPSRAWSAHIS